MESLPRVRKCCVEEGSSRKRCEVDIQEEEDERIWSDFIDSLSSGDAVASII